MAYIAAVDIGIRNLGLAVYDYKEKTLVEWIRVDLCEGQKYVPCKNVEYVHVFIAKYQHYFDNAHIVLVERQMRVNMRILESVFHSRFFEKCVIVAAQSVKLHFSICCRDYKKNKKRAVEWLHCHWNQMVKHHIINIDEWNSVWSHEKKQDDLADALIMLLYYVNTYSNIVNTVVEEHDD